MSDLVDVQAIDVSPNKCPIEKELNLTIGFKAAKDLAKPAWDISVRIPSRALPVPSPDRSDCSTSSTTRPSRM